MSVVAIVVVIAFWGAYRFPGFVEISMFDTQNPFLNRLGNGSTSCFVGFKCFGNTSCSFHVPFILHQFSFMFLSFACIFLSFYIHFEYSVFSIHVPFICIQFPSFSFHISFLFIPMCIDIPFLFIPMCIHVLSSSSHLHACSFHFAFMSFYFLSKVMKMALWLGQGTECNKWLSLSCR